MNGLTIGYRRRLLCNLLVWSERRNQKNQSKIEKMKKNLLVSAGEWLNSVFCARGGRFCHQFKRLLPLSALSFFRWYRKRRRLIHLFLQYVVIIKPGSIGLIGFPSFIALHFIPLFHNQRIIHHGTYISFTLTARRRE